MDGLAPLSVAESRAGTIKKTENQQISSDFFSAKEQEAIER
jgi:hypothetical protein